MNLIEFLRQQTIVPKEKAETFIDLLDTYEENDILYESAIRQLDLTESEYEELFTELEKQDYVDTLYIIQCPFCDSLGNTYVDKFDIPDADACRFCENEFNHKENYNIAYRVYFNYHKKIDIVSELAQKITYNQDRIFEIAEEINELESKRKAIQDENIKFVTLRNELMYDKNESKMYDKTVVRHKDKKVKYIGTLVYMKKCILKCSKCNEIFELFDVNNKFIAICPNCEEEIELVLK